MLVLTILYIRAAGFDVSVDWGRWFSRFSRLGFLVLNFSGSGLRALTFFWIMVAGFNAFLNSGCWF